MGSLGESLEVLVLCSSPVGDLATLKLPHELTEIENRLRKAQVPVRMKRVFPPTIDQLRRELAAISGHRDGTPRPKTTGRGVAVAGNQLGRPRH
ncbi:MAG: hypothetical protein IAG10_11080, partial [Planctomycetaceae bacterium]|nr:hypothetical protein [Planctomycetaceae bacterium]